MRTLLFPKAERQIHRHLACHRFARHRQRQLHGHRSLCAGEATRCCGRPSRSRAARACSTPSAAATCIPPASPGSRSALRGALWTLLSSSPATRSRAAPNAPCATTMSSSRKSRNREARLRAARAFLLGSLEQIWRDVARSGRLTPRSQHDDPAGLDLGHPPGKGRRRHGLSRGRSDRDFREQPLRAAVPRYPHRDPAISRPPGAFRNGRPGTARPPGRRRDVHILTSDDRTHRLHSPLLFARQRWSLDDIPWQAIRHDAVANSEAFFYLVASASLMESATDLYTENLIEFLAGDEEVTSWLEHYWLPEELQHGRALRRYVETAWPEFEWEPASRGSSKNSGHSATCRWRPRRSLEMASRCVVEMGTASYYTTLSRASPEPVLVAAGAPHRRRRGSPLQTFLPFFPAIPRGRDARAAPRSFRRCGGGCG